MLKAALSMEPPLPGGRYLGPARLTGFWAPRGKKDLRRMEDKGTPPAPPGPGRAGYYVRQPEGYRAFIPKPLPPGPPVDMGPEMHALLSRGSLFLDDADKGNSWATEE